VVNGNSKKKAIFWWYIPSKIALKNRPKVYGIGTSNEWVPGMAIDVRVSYPPVI